jgi:hypothetical protein
MDALSVFARHQGIATHEPDPLKLCRVDGICRARLARLRPDKSGRITCALP